jgi:hypothetical protein
MMNPSLRERLLEDSDSVHFYRQLLLLFQIEYDECNMTERLVVPTSESENYNDTSIILSMEKVPSATYG